MPPISTGKVTDRRALRFANMSEAIADAQRIAASEAAGTLRHSGNWSAGQCLAHVAAFMNYPYDGYPPKLNPPWIVKLLVKPLKKKYIRNGLPVGRSIPGIEGGTTGVDDISAAQALERFITAARRMESTPPPAPNPLFGPMTHDEWISLNLRHAELHFGFQHP